MNYKELVSTLKVGDKFTINNLKYKTPAILEVKDIPVLSEEELKEIDTTDIYVRCNILSMVTDPISVAVERNYNRACKDLPIRDFDVKDIKILSSNEDQCFDIQEIIEENPDWLNRLDSKSLDIIELLLRRNLEN